MQFEDNFYYYAYSLDAAVMKAQVLQGTGSSTYSVHNFKREKIEDVQNCAFHYQGRDNELLTFFNDVQIVDSYGVTLDQKFDLDDCKAVF